MPKPPRIDDSLWVPKTLPRNPPLKSGDHATAMRGWKLFLSQLYSGGLPFTLPDKTTEIGSLNGVPAFAPANRLLKKSVRGMLVVVSNPFASQIGVLML